MDSSSKLSSKYAKIHDHKADSGLISNKSNTYSCKDGKKGSLTRENSGLYKPTEVTEVWGQKSPNFLDTM